MEGGARLCCQSMDIALLPEGRPLENVDLESTKFGCWRIFTQSELFLEDNRMIVRTPLTNSCLRDGGFAPITLRGSLGFRCCERWSRNGLWKESEDEFGEARGSGGDGVHSASAPLEKSLVAATP
jgi:hypothetical protein